MAASAPINPDMGKKIYQQAKDLHVAKNVIYIDYNESDTSPYTAYKDPNCTIPYDADELEDAFIKGSIVVAGEGITIPTAVAFGYNLVYVSAINDDSSQTKNVIYTNNAPSDNGNAYKDSAGTTLYTADELKEAFMGGAIIVNGDVTYLPLQCTDGLTQMTVSYYISDSSTNAMQAASVYVKK